MAIAGTLAVNILARTDKFVKGIAKARKSVRGLSKSVKASTNVLGRWQKRLIAAVGIGAVGRMIIRTAEASDALAKMSDRLGFNAQQLEFYQFAAKRSGIETRTLTMAIQRLERRAGEAAKGMGEAQGALKDLNIDAVEFVKLDPHKQFAKILESTRGITNQNEKLRLFFKLFDSEGVGLIQMNEDMGELRKRFEELGGAQTDEGLAAATQFIDSLTDLTQSATKAGQSLVGAFGPGLKTILDATAATIERMVKAAKAFADILVLLSGGSFTSIGQTNRFEGTGTLAERDRRLRRIHNRPNPMSKSERLRQLQFANPQPRGEFEALAQSFADPIRIGTSQIASNPFPRSQKDQERILKDSLEVQRRQLRAQEDALRVQREMNNLFRSQQGAGLNTAAEGF